MGYNWLMREYNWQQLDWPRFTYNLDGLHDKLQQIAQRAGVIAGKTSHLSDEQQTTALIQVMIEEAIKTSSIEGENLNRDDIRSSIRKKLGIGNYPVNVSDKRAEGIVDMMFDVRETFSAPLSELKLCEWHIMLMSGVVYPYIQLGAWRTHNEPMQIVSYRSGREVIHFEAPPSDIVPAEMLRFIAWFNDTAPNQKHTIAFAAVRAAIAHLYFESIHPFEDGNGRVGRAIAEKALSQGFGYPVLISISDAIEANKRAYYEALHKASLSLEITPWINFFIDIILEAQQIVADNIEFIIKKAHFYDKYIQLINDRELKVIKRMFKEGVDGFEGGMSAKKYMKIADTSKATATRDLQHLHSIGAFLKIGQGRSVRYELNI